jgi:hypothetical protein
MEYIPQSATLIRPPGEITEGPATIHPFPRIDRLRCFHPVGVQRNELWVQVGSAMSLAKIRLSKDSERRVV